MSGMSENEHPMGFSKGDLDEVLRWASRVEGKPYEWGGGRSEMDAEIAAASPFAYIARGEFPPPPSIADDIGLSLLILERVRGMNADPTGRIRFPFGSTRNGPPDPRGHVDERELDRPSST